MWLAWKDRKNMKLQKIINRAIKLAKENTIDSLYKKLGKELTKKSKKVKRKKK